MDRRVFLVPILVVVAIIITLITGFFVLFGPSYFYYGFPLPWRLDYCQIQNTYGCPLFYWWAFAFDVVFYTAVEFGLFLGYARYRAR